MQTAYYALTQDSPAIEDEGFSVSLKLHQRVSVRAMMTFEETRFVITNDLKIYSTFGVLADKVGSGKTLTMLAFLQKSIDIVPVCREIVSYSSASVNIVKLQSSFEVCIKTNLIIVPHSLVIQWRNELTKTSLNYLILKTKRDIARLMHINPSTPYDNLKEYDVVVITNTMINTLLDYTLRCRFNYRRIIIDEADTMSSSKRFIYNCNFIWLITASYKDLCARRFNRILEPVHRIPVIANDTIIIRNVDSFVEASLNLPIVNYYQVECFTPKHVKILNGFVDRNIINMINSGNTEEAAKQLNCYIKTPASMIEAATTKLKDDLYNSNLLLSCETNTVVRDRDIEAKNAKINILKEHICNIEKKIKQLVDKIKEYTTENCPICLSSKIAPVVLDCCNNSFCMSCLYNINVRSCPMCRSLISTDKINLICDTPKIENQDTTIPVLYSKNENVIKIIKKNKLGRYLLVNNNYNSFSDMESLLNIHNITYRRLSGTADRITSTLIDFSNNKFDVILLNACDFGVGLNLQSATDLIICGTLTTRMEEQVIGRAQRPIRESNLNVYFLTCDYDTFNISTEKITKIVI